jgi:uncharacterized protein (TIGR01244 family)
MKSRVLLLAVALAILPACRQNAAQEVADTAGSEPVEQAPELLPNQRNPLPGVTTGGQPSQAQLEAAREAGYRTVINLRQPDERGVGDEPERVADLGLENLSIPIAGEAGLTEENTRAFARALEEAEYPVIVHCGSGNRIGALFALKAFYLDGKSGEEALEIGFEAGLTRLEDAVRERLEPPQ